VTEPSGKPRLNCDTGNLLDTLYSPMNAAEGTRNFASISKGKNTMIKNIVMASLLGCALATPALADDIKRDRRDIKLDVKDLHLDRIDLRRDLKDGASKIDILKDRVDIAKDRLDLRRDRIDLRRDIRAKK
jgi:hypothetical protein